jgi:hypothetical protein
MAKAINQRRRANPSGKMLKVVTPQTTDGINLRYDDDKQVVTKTTYLPITAHGELTRNENILPEHLRSKITQISKEDYEAEVKDLEDNAFADVEDIEAGDSLDDMTKAELQDEYERVLGEAPSGSLTKDELKEAIQSGK